MAQTPQTYEATSTGDTQAVPAPWHGPGGPKRTLPRRARRGAGLGSVMLGVIMLAIMLVGLLGVYNRVTTSVRTQAVLTTVTALESEIRRSFANAREYSNEAYHDFLAPRMPETAQRGAVGAEDIVTPWGGEITAGGGGPAGGAVVGTSAAHPSRFWIRVADLPRNACISIAESFLERDTVIEIRIDDAVPATARANRADIGAGCDGGDNDDVGIVFRG